MLVQDKPDEDNAVEVVELNNGCVCCTVKGSLVQTIDNLLERVDRASSTSCSRPPGSRIPTRGSGAWVDDEILEEDGAVLDAVVTLVDASNIEQQLSEGKEAAADRVRRHGGAEQCDLVSERSGLRSNSWRQRRGKDRPIHPQRRGPRRDPQPRRGVVRGRKAGTRPTLAGDLAQTAPAPGFGREGGEMREPPALGGARREHPHRVSGRGRRIDVGKFETWLEELLWEQAVRRGRTRAKGAKRRGRQRGSEGEGRAVRGGGREPTGACSRRCERCTR